jgi:PAS domain S-box-containing protein
MENEAAIRIVGYSARLVGAKRWCEAIGACLVDGDRPLRPNMPTMRACRGEEVRGLGWCCTAWDDRNILIEVWSSPLFGVDGKIVGAIANFNDITERRHAVAVEARLAALVRSTRAAVITWDSGGKVVDWNDGATRLLGYTADEMVGRDLSVLSMAGERRELGGSVNPTQTLYDRELVMRRRDGRPVHVAWTEAPVRDTRNVVGSAGVSADLSGVPAWNAKSRGSPTSNGVSSDIKYTTRLGSSSRPSACSSARCGVDWEPAIPLLMSHPTSSAASMTQRRTCAPS